MKHLKLYESFLNEAKKKKNIKPYSKIKVGDIAFENPAAGGRWDYELGKIIWKGTYDDLLDSKYIKLAASWEAEDESEFDDYDLVVVDDNYDGPTLYNYNNDPSGCVVFEK